MPREEMQEIILGKLRAIQGDKEDRVWLSGKQITELLSRHNPSSVRMALLLLHDRGLVLRERRKGRGKRGKTGQSAWYALIDDPLVLEDQLQELKAAIENRVDTQPRESV